MRFNGGTVVNDSGYLRISAGPLRDVYVHKLVMEAKLGRPIDPKVEEVHHKDGDRLNCHPDNLEVMTIPQHRVHENNKRSRARRALAIKNGERSRAQ